MEDKRKQPKSEETLKKMSLAKKGKRYSDEHRANISKGKSKKVLLIDSNDNVMKIYNSTLETALDGFTPTQVSLVCNGKRRHHKGYFFRYLEYTPIELPKKVDLFFNIMPNGEILLSENEKIEGFECYLKAKSHIYDKIKSFYGDVEEITIKMVKAEDND